MSSALGEILLGNTRDICKSTFRDTGSNKLSCFAGILLFLVEIAILCWVKFYSLPHTAAWVATGMLIPIMCVFIGFAALFYMRLVSHKSEVYEDGIKELQLLKDQLEEEDGNAVGGSPTPSRRGAASAVQVV